MAGVVLFVVLLFGLLLPVGGVRPTPVPYNPANELQHLHSLDLVRGSFARGAEGRALFHGYQRRAFALHNNGESFEARCLNTPATSRGKLWSDFRSNVLSRREKTRNHAPEDNQRRVRQRTAQRVAARGAAEEVRVANDTTPSAVRRARHAQAFLRGDLTCDRNDVGVIAPTRCATFPLACGRGSTAT